MTGLFVARVRDHLPKPFCTQSCKCYDEASVDLDLSEEDDAVPQPVKRLSWTDRLLTLYVFLAMALGLILGNLVPSTKDVLATVQFVGVSLPIAVGLLVMMYPILVKVNYSALPALFSGKKVYVLLLISVIINWIIAPLFMLALGWMTLPDLSGYRQGLVLVGLARCIAMVLLWTNLAGGDNNLCAVLVAFNSLLQIVLYAPLAILYLNFFTPTADKVTVQYSIVAKSVAVFLGLPLGAAILTRLMFLRAPEKWFHFFLKLISPLSLIGLLFTIIVIFASQAENFRNNIVAVVRVCVPLLLYFPIIFFSTFFILRKRIWGQRITVSFTAASNNFELAIAVAVAVFGPSSQQALATVVGSLIEVPVMVLLVFGVQYWHNRQIRINAV